MNVSSVKTKEYENKQLFSRGEKQTQSNPIYSEPDESTCSELACTEQGRSVEPISNVTLQKWVITRNFISVWRLANKG